MTISRLNVLELNEACREVIHKEAMIDQDGNSISEIVCLDELKNTMANAIFHNDFEMVARIVNSLPKEKEMSKFYFAIKDAYIPITSKTQLLNYCDEIRELKHNEFIK